MSKVWTPAEINKLFKITRTKTSLFRDEALNIIPTAERVKRGRSYVRAWKKSDLPALGKVYGFLKHANKNHVICVYTAKGGVLKTTISYNLARVFALNGMKTLVIGLDIQCSITDTLTNLPPINSIEQIVDYPGLYEASKPNIDGGLPLTEVIQKTDLPTLDYIPESINLNFLEQRIGYENKREYFLSDLIQPLKKDYQIIIFDNGPSWNFLIRNSLTAADSVISPLGCDIGTYKSVTKNIGLINNFKQKMDINWDNFIIVPTLLENTKISKEIEAQYRRLYSELITTTSIRRNTKGQESIIKNASVIESDPTSQFANDYYEIIVEIWNRILGAN